MEKLKVLIAEDIEVIAKAITNELEKIDGIEIICIAENGQVAYDNIIKLKPDLVLTDNQMPKLNGIDVIELINNYNFDKKIDFILITGDKDISLINRANILGVYKILNKPINYNELIEIINEYKTNRTINQSKSLNDCSVLCEIKPKLTFWHKILNFFRIK